LAAGSNVAMVVAACIVRTLPSILMVTRSPNAVKPQLIRLDDAPLLAESAGVNQAPLIGQYH
jgi:hypothetical protein